MTSGTEHQGVAGEAGQDQLQQCGLPNSAWSLDQHDGRPALAEALQRGPDRGQVVLTVQ